MRVCSLYGLPAIPAVLCSMLVCLTMPYAIWYPKAPILALPNYKPALGTAEQCLPHDSRGAGVKTTQDIGAVTPARIDQNPTAAHRRHDLRGFRGHQATDSIAMGQAITSPAGRCGCAL